MSLNLSGRCHTRATIWPRVVVMPDWRGGAALAAVLLAICGCGHRETVQHYRVLKPELVYLANHVAADAAADPASRTADADRLLGAIIPHGGQTWYFKMVGPRDAVTSQVEAFRALIASVEFEDAESAPHWRLPASWQERPGSGQRVATLVADSRGQTLEVSVIALTTGPVETALLDNVNRWRNQLGQPPLERTELAAATQTIPLAAGDATFVDIVGALQAGASAMVATPSTPAAGPAAANQDP